MAKKITIDPITRIEGHLRIDVDVEGGKVKNAWSSGQMFRGIEKILEGKHPNDAWFITQRFCGVCTTVHAIASVRTVENALGLRIPMNAEYVRNLILIAHGIHDHIVHFYHLAALDWVDVVSALKADYKKAAKLARSLSAWNRNSDQEFKAVQDKIKGFVQKGRLGIFANGYWGHKAMKLPPEVNLIAVVHYLQALEFQRYATQVYAILGGKNPHVQNLAVGGVSTAINPDDDSALNMEKLLNIKTLFEKAISFINNVHVPDVAAVASFYPEWFGIGGGVTNYLAAPDIYLDNNHSKSDLPGGTVVGSLANVKTIRNANDPYWRNNVAESTFHSWYQGDGKVTHPWKEDTLVMTGGYDPAKVDEKGKYSYVKAPRFKVDGKYLPFQVGPAAQVIVGFAQKHPLTVKWVTNLINAVDSVGVIKKKDIKPTILMSTLGRIGSRAVRCAMLGDIALKQWELLVNNIGKGDHSVCADFEYPDKEVQGVGFHEAPRGLLSHWCILEKGKIKKYQAVVPSTWNAGPRDENNMRGPYEEALINNPIADEKRPLEVLRTVHSFDPCLACAIHLFDPNGHEINKVKVL